MKHDDKQELNRIRRAINDPSHYAKMVDGVHTWDMSKIFKDFRAVIQIARRASLQTRTEISESQRSGRKGSQLP